jgi:hypothetical protein
MVLNFLKRSNPNNNLNIFGKEKSKIIGDTEKPIITYKTGEDIELEKALKEAFEEEKREKEKLEKKRAEKKRLEFEKAGLKIGESIGRFVTVKKEDFSMEQKVMRGLFGSGNKIWGVNFQPVEISRTLGGGADFSTANMFGLLKR